MSAKNQLQEYCQAQHWPLPEYITKAVPEGWQSTVMITTGQSAFGEVASKKSMAEKSAAMNLWLQLHPAPIIKRRPLLLVDGMSFPEMCTRSAGSFLNDMDLDVCVFREEDGEEKSVDPSFACYETEKGTLPETMAFQIGGLVQTSNHDVFLLATQQHLIERLIAKSGKRAFLCSTISDVSHILQKLV